jgi:hypothetical protein
MASAFVFTHARRTSEAATLEALRRDLLQRGRARYNSVLRKEAALRGDAGAAAAPNSTARPGASTVKLRPLRGCDRARHAELRALLMLSCLPC